MMRVGEFAMTTGLTVKALRHYNDRGLLVPASIEDSGYRNYGVRQLRTAMSIRALREIGLSLDEVAVALANPDRTDELIAEHAVTVARDRIRQDDAAARGAAMILALDTPCLVEVRECLTQHWAGLAIPVATDDAGSDPTVFDAAFARVWKTLSDTGAPPTAAWWTTLRLTSDVEHIEVVCCWPIGELPAGELRVDHMIIETGTLPTRQEIFVTLPQRGDAVNEGQGQAAHIAVLEYAAVHQIDLADASVRQIGVLDADGIPVAIELTMMVR